MTDPVTGAQTTVLCINCPHHRIINDPDPDDWFCDDDKAVVCSITQNPKPDPEAKYLADRSPYRRIAGSVRPYQTKDVPQPDWCPLLTAKKN